MGLLKITGAIRVDQFWPRGKSDADASKIKITVNSKSFSFAENGEGYKTVSLFDDAYTEYGRKKSKVIKRSNQILCRLSGVDAPVLNYAPYGATPQKHPTKKTLLPAYEYQNLITIINTTNYRQPFAETCVIKLSDYIAASGKGNEIPCVFIASANSPQDVCDCYGRFVGDVFIYPKGKEVNVNHWLLENGWAFPSFYHTMDVAIIAKLQQFAETGKQKKGGVYTQYRKFFGRFEDVDHYREPEGKSRTLPDVANTNAYLMHPKIFRIWCRYNMYLQAGIQPGSFTDFVNANTTGFYYTHDFINSTEGMLQPTLLSSIATRNRFDAMPEDIVFVKRPSELKDSKGVLITEW